MRRTQCTYERTNERTNERSSNLANATYCSKTRTPAYKLDEDSNMTKSIRDAIADVFGTVITKERWPAGRQGEREPIPSATRIGVGRRDNFTCRYCHVDCWDSYELDHIIPWSAGGSDKSDNLRVLCKRCNQDRSNFRDGTEERKPLPIAFWCDRCYPGLLEKLHEAEAIHTFCVECRLPGLTDEAR